MLTLTLSFLFSSGVDGEVARVDYNTSTVFFTIPAGPAGQIVSTPVDFFDDNIDEAFEEFFIMFLEGDDPRVDLTRSNIRYAARGIIRDNEGICCLILMAV